MRQIDDDDDEYEQLAQGSRPGNTTARHIKLMDGWTDDGLDATGNSNWNCPSSLSLATTNSIHFHPHSLGFSCSISIDQLVRSYSGTNEMVILRRLKTVFDVSIIAIDVLIKIDFSIIGFPPNQVPLYHIASQCWCDCQHSA